MYRNQTDIVISIFTCLSAQATLSLTKDIKTLFKMCCSCILNQTKWVTYIEKQESQDITFRRVDSVDISEKIKLS